ncbi:probable PHO88 (involved in phosphate transport) [Cephalotrichum gorgonifer]|uniref:Probable PHO88 (Involved in phosphate transport) n=1 Tax=Cephalotrichum gorgonifer TaxID=2041049 RepID=A0AAE8N285_9PEZI|nr:probable PHO88 (involved in phosphate transport) [Cephalotrichum gorgonifer]
MAIPPAALNLVVVLGVMQIAKRVPFDNPDVLNGVRGMYLASNLIILAIYYLIHSKINKKKDMTTLKYVEPPAMGSSEEGKLVTTTINAYDNLQLRNLVRAQVMGVAMMCFMHLYMKYTNPLVVQSIIPLKTALESNLAKIYIWGQPASGDLKRPFKTGGGLMAGLQQGPAQSDKKAVEEAEKSGRGGAKEE